MFVKLHSFFQGTGFSIGHYESEIKTIHVNLYLINFTLGPGIVKNQVLSYPVPNNSGKDYSN